MQTTVTDRYTAATRIFTPRSLAARWKWAVNNHHNDTEQPLSNILRSITHITRAQGLELFPGQVTSSLSVKEVLFLLPLTGGDDAGLPARHAVHAHTQARRWGVVQQ
jgi:hypothetical protein